MKKEHEKSRTRERAAIGVILAVAGLLTVLGAAGSAFAHDKFPGDSVNNGQIRYADLTRADNVSEAVEFGVEQWNKLGSVRIRQAGSAVDLEFRDFDNCKSATTGFWQPRSGPDRIGITKCGGGGYSQFDRRGTATHEVGHALGLDHNKLKRSIMSASSGRAFNTPQAHDKEDYYELFGGSDRSATGAERQGSGSQSQSEASAGSSDIRIEHAFNVRDKRKLVGYATNAFVGRVVEQVGSEGAPLSGPGEQSLPQTQLSVEVLRSIKGDLAGTVAVNRIGGYDEEEGREVQVEGDQVPVPGQKYLFVTSYDERRDWYTVVAQPFGSVPMADEAGRAGEVEEKFTRAAAAQISPTNPR